MTTYQRLKAENLKLKQELILLANEPNSIDGIIIKNKWVFTKKAEDAYMAGNINDKVIFYGLLSRIKSNEHDSR